MTSRAQAGVNGPASGGLHRVRPLLSLAVLGVAAFLLGNWLGSEPPALGTSVVSAKPELLHQEHSAHVALPDDQVAQDAAGAGATQAVTDELTGPGVKPPPTYLPRDLNEWQGMLVDLSFQPDCTQATDCGWARACVAGHCSACSKDSECGADEACVLDHCVLRSQASCRSHKDCAGQLCILTGFSSDGRNNAEMRAVCNDANGGRVQDPSTAEMPEENPGPAQAPEIDAEQLRKLLREE